MAEASKLPLHGHSIPKKNVNLEVRGCSQQKLHILFNLFVKNGAHRQFYAPISLSNLCILQKLGTFEFRQLTLAYFVRTSQCISEHAG